jgi:4-hydroxy-3-methylbut-2-enyl diphosphate reductase
MMRIILAQPRGFCAGVVRAIDIVERAIEVSGRPVYVRHEIVHNKHVVDSLRAKGATFVEEVDEIPDGSIAIFSAHGVARSVEGAAIERGLATIDATCPLVTKVHRQVARLDRLGYEIILIGHDGHPEVEGTMGQLPGRIILVQDVAGAESVEVADPEKVAYVTQTTLSLDDTAEIVATLKRRFPAMPEPPTEDICYATTNRQHSIRRLAALSDLVIVIGAPNSSNSNRLVEVAASCGTQAHRVQSAVELEDAWFNGVETVAITAGASVPEYLVDEVVAALRSRFGAEVIDDPEGEPELVEFPLPKGLREAAPAASGPD